MFSCSLPIFDFKIEKKRKLISKMVFNHKLAFFGCKKAAIFTIPIAIGIDAENQCLINHPDSYRDFCGALNRQFLEGAVISRFSLVHFAVVKSISPVQMYFNVSLFT